MESESYSSEAAVEIPADLWIEILARVPINLVLKFRRLSKFHRDLIYSPNFMEKHSDLSEKPSFSWGYVILSSFLKDYWVKKVDLISNSDAIVLHTLTPPQPNYECVGCCEGILLLRSSQCIMLWNPLTRASRSFPHVDNEDMSYFLGQDEVTADLKILKAVQRHEGRVDCEIYSSRSECWRKVIENEHHLKSIKYFSGAKFAEGTNSVHMLARESGTPCNQIIVAFDFSAEKFNRKFHLPPQTLGAEGLSSLDGCLCVYVTHDNGVLRLWMMKEYGVMESWEPKLFICPKFIHLMQLDFVDSGRRILAYSRSGMQLVSDLDSLNDFLEKKLNKKAACSVEQSVIQLDFLNRCFEYAPSLRRV